MLQNRSKHNEFEYDLPFFLCVYYIFSRGGTWMSFSFLPTVNPPRRDAVITLNVERGALDGSSFDTKLPFAQYTKMKKCPNPKPNPNTNPN